MAETPLGGEANRSAALTLIILGIVLLFVAPVLGVILVIVGLLMLLC